MLGVTILGNNSALPAFNRRPTAQVVTLDDQLFLVDCGEGTQMQFSQYRIRWGRINHIFVSHLHGDHYYGLPGLLNSMSLLQRVNDLHLYGPPELEEILQMQFRVAFTSLSYTLHFHPLTASGLLIDLDRFKVRYFPTQHRIPCFGFRFDQVKPPRRVIAEKAREFGIPAVFMEPLKWGENYTDKSGNVIQNDWVTAPSPPPKSYAYCADTLYTETLLPHIRGVSLLYHEATYLKADHEKARSRYHSTTTDAATLARKAGVQRLLIGHFSSKYELLEPFETETREVFPDAELALEGVTYRVIG